MSGLNFKKLKQKYVAGGELSPKDCCIVWNALVRPALEYGAVVWGDVKWEEAEAVQREMGKMILRCSSK